MSTRVEVALIGSIKRQKTGGDMIPPSELRKPYRDLPKYSREVTNDTPLGTIAQEALEEMGAPSWAARSPSFDVGFYRPEDEQGVDGNWSWFIVLVDERGQARWKYPVNDVTFGDVVRAAEAGAVQGDPTRMHVAMTPQIGDGVLPMWPQIVDSYRLLKEVLDVLGAPGALYASYQLIKNMRSRSGDAVESLESKSGGWAERGANPYTFEQWLDDHPWDPEILSGLLDCSTKEAEAILWAMGFAPTDDRVWRRARGAEAELMDGNRTMIVRMGLEHATEEEIKRVLRERIEKTAETGIAPDSPNWRQLPWMQRQVGDAPVRFRIIEWLLARWNRFRN